MMFSSARKMMSWAVPLPGGGWRLYSKGASEVILSRCSTRLTPGGTPDLSETDALGPAQESEITKKVINVFASEAMRTIGLAYRDFDATPDWEETHETILNADGSPAFKAESGLTLLGVVGIEDPLRPSNNVGRNCFRIYAIQQEFSKAQQLCAKHELNPESHESPEYPILSRLLRELLPSV